MNLLVVLFLYVLILFPLSWAKLFSSVLCPLKHLHERSTRFDFEMDLRLTGYEGEDLTELTQDWI